MVNQALFSNKKEYRYMLSRFWDEKKPIVGIIGLAPSYADAKNDDEEILKQIHLAKALGYGGLYSLNLFALLSLDKETKSKNLIGESNNKYIKYYSSQCKIVIGAWGDEGSLLSRGTAVRNLFSELYHCGLTPLGEPIHFENIEMGIEPQKF